MEATLMTTATLNLNLGEALSKDELTTLIDLAMARGVSIERILYEAARDLAERRRAGAAQLALPIAAPLGKGGAA
jgi:Zn-dependent peptidase ImmA (M78 family)